MKTKKICFAIFLSILLFSAVNSTFAQTTAFNFQGRLNDGSNAASGNYDLRFKLFDAIAGGAQVGSTIDRPNLQVVNGVFSTALDFGAAAFAGGNRFLEISVRPFNSPNAHVVLGARQQILAVPYAAQATNSTNATNATNAENATTATNSLSLGGVSAGNFARLNFANQGDISAANMSTTGYLSVGGNVVQPAAANGLVKAMLYIFEDGTISRCYNGITGSTVQPCGFTVTQPLGKVGVYRINLGIPNSGRFVQVTPETGPIGTYLNYGATFRFITGDQIEVFTFRGGNSSDTFPDDFMVFVY